MRVKFVKHISPKTSVFSLHSKTHLQHVNMLFSVASSSSSRGLTDGLLLRRSSPLAMIFYSSYSSDVNKSTVDFKVILDGTRHAVSASVNEQLSKVLAKHRDVMHAVPIISPMLGHDAHVIVPEEVRKELEELTGEEMDKIEELCSEPLDGGRSRLASQLRVSESFAGMTFAVKGMNRIMRT